MVDYVDVYLEYCDPVFLVVDRIDAYFEYFDPLFMAANDKEI
jgi:hypothetical protein